MKINKLILIILLFFQFACGYKIANKLDDYNFQILDYKLIGEKKVNNILERNFRRFIGNENSLKVFEIKSNSKLIKSTTSKDSSGDALSYELKVLIELEILENNELLNKFSFSEKTDYNNINSKFELKQYEDILLNDLVNQITLQINNNLNSIK